MENTSLKSLPLRHWALFACVLFVFRVSRSPSVFRLEHAHGTCGTINEIGYAIFMSHCVR